MGIMFVLTINIYSTWFYLDLYSLQILSLRIQFSSPQTQTKSGVPQGAVLSPAFGKLTPVGLALGIEFFTQ